MICGKSGTLTFNQMKVSQFHCESRKIMNTRKDTILNCDLTLETVERIKESILYNTEAHVEMTATTYVPVGNGTETCLLRFLQDADIPIHLLINRKLGKIKAISPFSPLKKRSAVALLNPDRPDTVSIYVKGAPEVIVQMCQYIQSGVRPSDLDEEELSQINQKVNFMAAEPLKVISFAYFDMSITEWEATYEQDGISSDKLFEDFLNSGSVPLTFIGTFGLKDTIRPTVQSCVKYARDQGHITVRLVSGDHFETAKKVALTTGILKKEEQDRNYSIMSF